MRPAVARLRAAGAVFVGRTNMVEFAFGTTGHQPALRHAEESVGPRHRKRPGRLVLRRGGGAGRRHVRRWRSAPIRAARSASRRRFAASPASSRPRAACRATAHSRFPTRSIRSGRSPIRCACCAAYDALLAGEAPTPLPELPVKGLQFLLPKSEVRDGLDREVAQAFETASSGCERAGALVTEKPRSGVRSPGRVLQGRRLRRRRGLRDPSQERRPPRRIRPARGQARDARQGPERRRLRRLRPDARRRSSARSRRCWRPSTRSCCRPSPCIAPPIAEVNASDEAYFRWNGRILRN